MSFDIHLTYPLRDWQNRAFEIWSERRRGIASVVTGAGKTTFALKCISEFHSNHKDGITHILVPTLALLDQWCVSIQEAFRIPESEIGVYSGQERTERPGKVNVLVLNTARKDLPSLGRGRPTFLVVDECHRAATPENSKGLRGKHDATLGISATPYREFDDGFQRYLLKHLGAVFFTYGYPEALADGILAPFELCNVKIPLTRHEAQKHKRLSRRVAVLHKELQAGEDVRESLEIVLRKRAVVSAKARARVPVAVHLAERESGSRTIIFHERIDEAEKISEILKARKLNVERYHSKLSPDLRRDNLRLFRRGIYHGLVTCRALDEGIDVPEASVAIIASSTASARQRIQRLGRVLRPAPGKDRARVITLFATREEETRLLREAEKMEGVAGVTWNTAGF